MISLEKINKLATRLKTEINAYDQHIIKSFPPENYINHIHNYPQVAGYRYVSKEINDYCDKILKNSNEKILELYHKLILVMLIIKAKNILQNKRLPEDVKIIFGQNFKRIIKDIELNNNSLEFYKYSNDKFCKDFAVCSLRMIPVGAMKMNLSGIQRKVLFKKGWTQFIKLIIYVFFELGGFKPLYEMHIDSHDPDLMAQYNYQGRQRSYISVSEILKMNNKIKGIFAINWYFDPQLEKISPRLNYVRDLFIKNGGKLFYLGTSAQGIKDATFKSPTRRKLYNEGKYMPTDYLAVWSSKKLINWAYKSQFQKNLWGNRDYR